MNPLRPRLLRPSEALQIAKADRDGGVNGRRQKAGIGMTEWDERWQWGRRIDELDPRVGNVMANAQLYLEADMKLERVRWKRAKGRQHLLLDKVYSAVTEEFTRDAMASLATVLAHLCIVTDVAKLEAVEAFGDAYDEARDMLSGSGANASLLN